MPVTVNALTWGIEEHPIYYIKCPIEILLSSTHADLIPLRHCPIKWHILPKLSAEIFLVRLAVSLRVCPEG